MAMHKSDWDYQGLVAECYDLWFGEEPFWDQAFFEERLRRNGGVALEVGCGTGRLLLPFLRDGLQVEGVDASAEMLALCRQKAAALDVAPVLYQQHMQEINLPQRYHTIFVPACSFQILATRQEAFATLRHLRQHLAPGGELLLTLEVPWNDFGMDRQWRLRRSGTRPTDGDTVLIHEATVSDRREQLQDIWLRYEVFKDGQLVQTLFRQHQLRWYHQHEFVLMLEAVGFQAITVQSGYGVGDSADPEADMIFSAKL
jgi:ubiquinone/menaquinone biosynthesis C-methylase UbiE